MVVSKLVLDTNAYSNVLEGERAFTRLIENSNQIYIPIIVVAELLFGFRNGNRYQQNLASFNKFISESDVSVLQTTYQTAEIFADIRLFLKQHGRPIPSNDIWIAAQTIESGSQLLTFDKHFEIIPGLRIIEV